MITINSMIEEGIYDDMKTSKYIPKLVPAFDFKINDEVKLRSTNGRDETMAEKV
jgi:hypothetical protein